MKAAAQFLVFAAITLALLLGTLAHLEHADARAWDAFVLRNDCRLTETAWPESRTSKWRCQDGIIYTRVKGSFF